jgi:hypothetical protein
MIVPEIKIEKVGDDIICKIFYDNVIAHVGYKSDGTPFVLSDKSTLEVSNEFRTISGKMWSAVCDKFDMNPGYALEAGLIDLKYCKQMQLASIIGYDLCSMAIYKNNTYRVKEFIRQYLELK